MKHLPINCRQIRVLHKVLNVAQFVVNGGEVVIVHLDAHFHAQIINIVDVPGRRMANHFAVAGMHKLRTLPEGGRERRR